MPNSIEALDKSSKIQRTSKEGLASNAVKMLCVIDNRYKLVYTGITRPEA